MSILVNFILFFRNISTKYSLMVRIILRIILIDDLIDDIHIIDLIEHF